MEALLFELDSIQDFLFASGRLRDVTGASELLDRLTNPNANDNLLDAVCEAAGLSLASGEVPQADEIAFSRRAGGAFYAFSQSRLPLEKLRDLWTLAIQQAVPHLTYSLGMGSGDTAAEAFQAARQALMADNSRLRPTLPAAAPVAVRSRRTGLPGVEFDAKGKDGVRDAATVRRKAFADLSNSTFLQRFNPEEANLAWRDWPRDLEPEKKDSKASFPFKKDETPILALIHADGNGLGLILQALNNTANQNPDVFIPLYSEFSRLVDRVTSAAAKTATAQVLLPARQRDNSQCLPARPILLGGDDITLLVRADLAMDYVRTFTESFEKESEEALSQLQKARQITGSLPRRLTLGIGLVYLRATQPFRMAIRLAESLTKTAKQAAKAHDETDPPSAIAFHRVTASLIEDYDDLVAQALTHHHGNQIYLDTLGAYFLGNSNLKPGLDDLLELTDLLGADDMARGPTRQLFTLMGHSLGEARQRYRRWRQVMQETHKEKLKHFDQLMNNLAAIKAGNDLPYSSPNNNSRQQRTPLGDVLALMGAGHKTLAPGSSSTNTKEEAAA